MALIASSRRRRSLVLLPVSTSYRPRRAPLLRPPHLRPRHPPLLRHRSPPRAPQEGPPRLRRGLPRCRRHLLRPAGMVDHALRTLDEIPSLGNPRIDLSLNALLLALNGSPLSSSCRRVPDLSRRLSIAPDKVSYGILVKSHCLSGDAKKAFAVLKEMDQ